MSRKPAGYWHRKEVVEILLEVVHEKINELEAERRLAALPDGPVGPRDVKWYADKTRKAVDILSRASDDEITRIMRTLLVEKMV